MRISASRIIAIAAVASISLLGTAACSSDDSSDSSSSTSAAAAATSASSDSASASAPSGTADPAADLVGPGCADYAKANPSGGGSVAGMAQDPVAVAASNNPLLKTLVQAVSGQLNPKVNLVDTLNGGQFTVFAPVDDAFAKIDPATIDTLKTDDALLTKILTYHVVPGRIAPNAIAGQHPTVEGGTVNVTGSGNDLKVNDANVICGGVTTANATVYLIDSVLMPPA
ncbi:fasciclin domain-containing protein [Antrihabitans cavernicola]|uniref:Fasciclin domain-containing protein n=1 Tax=Antrihabitans cavernicola TaxID=2495913 RepID=A0A5A7SBP0_9NOCA|nr:fasciclin domain-containing protein [Spelaeibacter cavernicola]KAA0022739.1 fasciclin domain-containing protein [Spelaeibacter cavernicola]